MNPYTKAAQFVIRLIGFGFIVVSLSLLATNLPLILSRRPVDHPLGVIMEAIPFLIGCAILWKSTAIARGLTQDLGDDE